MAGLMFWWRGDTVNVRIGSVKIQADVVDTEAERATGLRNKMHLTDNHGMLFVFPHDAKWEIWMKDMKIPIDIVWIDASKKVVAVQANVSPTSYPGHFAPPAEARYVLELASGVAQRSEIEPGVRADFTVSQATK